MKRAPLLLLLLVPVVMITCGRDEPTGPSEGPSEVIRSARPPGPPPGPPSGPPAGPPPQAGTTSGRKFNDLDADATDDGGAEPGLSGWEIRAYGETDADGVLDTLEFAAGAVESDTTDGIGSYELTLAPGRYIVCEVLQAAWMQSAPANATCAVGLGLGSGGHAITVTGGSVDSLNNFGNFQEGRIIVGKQTDPDSSAQVFNFDGPGTFDPSLSDGDQDTLEVVPGAYQVTETVPAGWDLTSIVCSDSNSTGNVGTATAIYNVEAGETVTCTFNNRQ